VYWLQRPPYLRRAAAVLLVIGALAWDLRPDPAEMRPFAAHDLTRGEAVGSAEIVWRRVPAGILPEADLNGAVAAVDVVAGTPLLPGVLRAAPAAPEGWWGLPLSIGPHAAAGDTVMLLATDPPLAVPGLVLSGARGDAYSLDHRPAVVAVPGEQAALVAAADARGTLVAATD
jgi:hypothetical protein